MGTNQGVCILKTLKILQDFLVSMLLRVLDIEALFLFKPEKGNRDSSLSCESYL